jgi:hypothetical protein
MSPIPDEIIVHIRRGRVVAELGPLVTEGRTQHEALERLRDARSLYRLLLVHPNSPGALRLAAEINELYAA